MILQLIRLLLLPAPSSAVASPLSSAPPAAFTRFGLPADLDCGRMLAADPPALSAYSAQRLRLDDRQPLAIDCASIRARHLLPAQPMSAGEAEFPLAFSRTVYKDYHFLEAELAATFAPQNWYCFALDAKADPLFRARMHALAKCLPNVLLTTKELAMDSQGHNQSASHFECMKELAQPGRAWRYLLLLQNSDVQLKSNEELVQILRWFNGSSDVEICAPERLDPGKDWSFAGLRLFRSSAASPRGQLPLAKGYLESTLSRQFVDFLVHKLDLTRLLAQIDGGRCFVDEHFLQMLLTSDELNAPGRFTQACLERGYSTPYVTKLVAWFANSSRCHSKFARHHACIFGMEDLGPLFSTAHSLVANKMSMDFDWGAIRCWHELMHNRTYLNRGTHRLKAQVYLELPQVRYHNARMNRKSRPEEGGFDCRYKIDKEDAVKMYDGRQDQQIKKRTDAEIRAKAEREARGQCHTAEENGRRR